MPCCSTWALLFHMISFRLLFASKLNTGWIWWCSNVAVLYYVCILLRLSKKKQSADVLHNNYISAFSHSLRFLCVCNFASSSQFMMWWHAMYMNVLSKHSGKKLWQQNKRCNSFCNQSQQPSVVSNVLSVKGKGKKRSRGVGRGCKFFVPHLTARVGQNRTYALYMIVCMVIFLLKIPYVHRIHL